MTEWFSPKRFGYGSGLPIAWQGWALILTYLVIVSGAIALTAHKPLALAGIVIPPTVALVIISAKTTRGGWRWRWGERE